MKNKKWWLYLAVIMIILGIGIFIGILIGMPIGETKGLKKEEEVFLQQEQKLPGATEGAKTTGTVIPEAPTDEVTPTKSPEESVKPTEPTAKPEPTVTPSLTPTPALTATQKPTATPKPTVTPKTTATPKPTAKPTATPKPTDIPTAQGEKGYYGRLHVEGTYLADEDNNLVQLRGVSTHGIGWFPQYVNEAAIRQFNEDWGCNVFRLAMYTAEGAGYCTNGDAQKEKLKQIIHTGVEAAIKEDMYVIIDWHVLQDQDPNKYKDEAKKFFAEMAKTYGDDPHVIYEICNEPNSGTSWSRIKSYALEVIPVIREHAPHAIIIVGTPTWSQDVDIAANDPITAYDNVMYALHFYAETHQDSLRNKCKTAVAKGLPVFVTEYGICDASGNGIINEKQANLWIEMLDSYGISHVMWNLANKNESSSMIAAGNSKVNGFTEKDLSTSGKWFVNMLQKAGVGIGSALSGTTEAGQGEAVGNGGSSESGNGNSGGNTGESSGSNTPEINQGFDVAKLEEVLTADVGLSYTVSNSWNTEEKTFIQLALTVSNDSSEKIFDWERKLTVSSAVKVELDSGCWGAVATKSGNVIVIKPADYTKEIEAGGSVGNIGITIMISE